MSKDQITLYILKDKQRVENCVDFIRKMPTGEKYCVEIKEYNRTRTLAQNSLYWSYMTVIGNEMGCSKDEASDVMKTLILGPRTRQVAGITLIELPETKTMTVREMMDYLREIEIYAAQEGWKMPVPDDYKFAMSD